MRRAARSIMLAAAGVAALAGWSGRAAAQLDTTHTWRFDVTPYGWLPELNGQVGVGPLTSSVNVSASDILSALKSAGMIYAEARYGPGLISIDALYTSVGVEHVFSIEGATPSLEFTQSQTMIQPMVGYTYGARSVGVDLLAGFRYWDLSATLDVDRTLQPSVERADSRHWFDALGGVRTRWMPLPRVRFLFDADAGVGGSKGTWQIYSALGYDIWSPITLSLAYRALSVDYYHDNFLYDTTLQGLLFGLSFRIR